MACNVLPMGRDTLLTGRRSFQGRTVVIRQVLGPLIKRCGCIVDSSIFGDSGIMGAPP